jgi:hypothetical protein
MKRFILLSFVLIFAFMLSVGVFAAVTFTGKDTTTKGDWTKKYGKDGAIVFGIKDMSDMKNISAFDDAKNTRWDWANPTADTRGLTFVGDTTKRTGACMYNNPDTVLTLTPKISNYQVALYCCDWDSTARIEDIAGYQGATVPAKADVTAQNPEFPAGVYYLWSVTGSDPFKLSIKFKAGANWVISGIFIDAISGTAVQPNSKLATTWGSIRASN